MLRCQDDRERICDVLYDVIEDTDITYDDLRAEHFDDDIITILEILTKKAGESYDDFIGRVLANDIACRVKLADLLDNMDLTRIKNPTVKDKERIEKYRQAVERITGALTCTKG